MWSTLLATCCMALPQTDRTEESRLVGDGLDAQFGSALTATMDRFYAGTPSSDAVQTGTGIVRHFKRVGDPSDDAQYRWAARDALVPFEAGAASYFGGSISGDHDHVAVGMPLWQDYQPGTNGRVVVFERVLGSLQVSALLPSKDRDWGELVVLDGDRLLVRGDGSRHDTATVWSYVRSGSTWVEDLELFDPAGGRSEGFGFAMALEGDRAVITAPGHDSFLGAAWILERTAGVWQTTAKLQSPNPTGSASFGHSVAMSGDLVAVGAPGFHGSDAAGRVFTYREVSPGTWTHESTYRGANATHYGQFGDQLAMDGDRLVVGAPLERTVGGVGRAHLIEPTGITRLEPTTSLVAERVGYRVAVEGSEVAVAAYSSHPSSQAVWTFRESGGAWLQESELVPLPGDAYFPQSVTFSGSELMVSDPGAYSTTRRGGLVREYRRLGNQRIPVDELQYPDEIVGDAFGASVDASGNAIAVGCPCDDEVSVDGGSVYLFRFNGQDTGKITPTFTQAGDRFGTAVRLDDQTLAVSAPGDDVFVANGGAVHVYEGSRNSWTLQSSLRPDGSFPFEGFGAALGLDGDLLAVGAPHAPGPRGANVGAVMLYRRARNAWSLDSTLQPTHLPADARFGASIQLDGDRLLVGAPGHDLDGVGVDSGAAYLFRSAMGAWRETPRLQAPSPAAGDAFGTSADLQEARILIGAPGMDVGATDSGAAILFADCGIGVPAFRAVAASPATGQTLGMHVVLADDVDFALASAPNDLSDGVHSGSVLSFDAVDDDFATDDFVASAPTVNATGGVVEFGLCVPTPVAPDDRFFVLGSLRGSDPGFLYDGFTIPLNIDAYFALTARLPDALFLQPSIGSFADDGRAAVRFEIPALPSGLTFTHAFVIFDPATGDLSYVSTPIEVHTN